MKNTSFAFVIYKVFLIIALLTSALIIPHTYTTGHFRYLRLLIIIIILAESINLFRILFIKSNWEKFANMGVVLLSLFIIIMTLEIVFMFVTESHLYDFTLASKNWFNKFWKPINSFGFRDEEPNFSNPAIFFIGDSFTVGHGLKKTEERFSNIVSKKLLDEGYKYSVLNLGVTGLDTRAEYDLMINFIKKNNVTPSKIVLQYYGNDIEGVAEKNGLTFPGYTTPYSDIPKYLMYLVKGSYLANFIYWRFPKQYIYSYGKYLENTYKNQKVVSEHKNDIKRFIDFCNENSIELIVVVFPFMQDLNLSDTVYVKEILKYLYENKVKTINVSPLIENIPLNDRVVNKFDGHPSKKINIIVAKEILKLVKFE